MTTEKNFICECGRQFTNGQAFNGHKSACKIHNIAKYGNLDLLTYRYKATRQKGIITLQENTKKKKASLLDQWLSERHYCEHCGQIMTEKFGSGRFCSRACANSRSRSIETRNKISKTVSKANQSKGIKKANIAKYDINPKYCQICGTIIEYDRRNAETCINRACQLAWAKQQAAGKTGGFRLNSHSYGKHGFYKGYRCDSTYELVYIIYNLDHNIYFERNHEGYPYKIDGKLHKYYPDFRLADGSLVEIKGWVQESVFTKLAAVSNVPIKLLTKSDLKYAFDYVKENYNYIRLEDLYD